MLNQTGIFAALLAALLVVLAPQHSSASSSVRSFPESLDGLSAGELCQYTDKRISGVATIKHLTEIFKQSSSDNTPCRDEWLNPLEDLEELIESAAEDSCSYQTAHLFEEFQWNWVIGTLSKRWKKASWTYLPEPLKFFFLQFAQDTTKQCTSQVVGRLTEAVAKANFDGTSLSSVHYDLLTDALTLALVPRSKVKSYDNFFFIFNANLIMERKKGREPIQTASCRTGESQLVAVKVSSAEKPREIQDRCRKILRPIYTNTVLPLMKLIDVGFGSKGQSIEGDTNKLVAEWYSYTQLCELILPIRFYQSKELKDDQVGLIKKEDEDLIDSSEASKPIDELPANIEVERVELVEVLATPDQDSLIKEIKDNFKWRSRVYRKTFKNTLNTIRSMATSRVRKIFAFRKKNNQFVLDEGEDLDASLSNAEKMSMEDELEDRKEDGYSSAELVRLKRSKAPPREPHGAKVIAFSVLALFACAVVAVCICAMLGVFGHPAG